MVLQEEAIYTRSGGNKISAIQQVASFFND
jgi:hypothetical protein